MSCLGNPNKVYILERAPVVSGTDFRSASPGSNSNTGQLTVNFTLTNEAGERFFTYTSANVGKDMAVVMGKTVREVAVIKSGIHDSGLIEGGFTQQEVTDLSKLLQTGSLPASLVFLEDRTVGASLGADSIREGVTAAVVGVLVVMAFMLIYYKRLGHQCRPGAVPEPGDFARVPGLHRSYADIARNCRSDSDHRYGRGFERADLRAHPRGDSSWKGGLGGSRPGLCAMPG